MGHHFGVFDKASVVMRKRATYYQSHPPPSNWKGIWTLPREPNEGEPQPALLSDVWILRMVWRMRWSTSAFEGPRRPNELLRALELCPAANSEGIRAGSDTWSHAEQTPQASDVW